MTLSQFPKSERQKRMPKMKSHLQLAELLTSYVRSWELEQSDYQYR